ncbi:MAG: hypothetical protein GY766_27285 [Herbaspirillum sp.]|uniref:phage tail length tape measure family protein n=1 Tax=Herbaspirillum sp. TaxID=1890675 RepID=UPI00258C23DF|nr:phage tail length tape measure family protein [Herbaspirillum sp.]MCP3658561.1 hypothetical protein [Herbaspirillum sp.]
MAVAELGYKIDSSGAVVAAANLDDMTAAAARAEVGAQKVTVQSAKAGMAMKASSAQVANLGAQFNDIGVMLAAGQSPLQLAVQQGTQINQVFAQMGGGKAALRGLGAGFMSMVNPMSLATIGIIAGGAALIQWISSAAGATDEAKELAEAMEGIRESTRDAKLELQAMEMGLGNVEQVFVQQQINALMSQREVLSIRLSDLNAQDDIHSKRKAAATGRQILLLDNEVQKLRDVISAEDEANRKIEERNYLTESANMFLEAQQRIRNENGARMQEQIRLEQKLVEELGKAEVAILKLAGVDLKNIDDASIRAASLAASMGIAYSQAYALANVDFAPLGGGLQVGDDLLPTNEELTGVKPGRVGGGGGGAKVDQYAADLEALKTSLMTEREVLEQWKLEQDILLADERALELLGMEGHEEAKLRLKMEYMDRLSEIERSQSEGVVDAQNAAAGAAMDFLSTLAGRSEGAAKALIAINTGLSIAQAIQNTAVAATRALAELGPIAGPPAAATIAAYGKAQVGLIAANGVLKLSGAGRGGGGSVSAGGTSSSAGVTATSSAAEVAPQTQAIIQIEGGRTRFTVDELNDIIAGIQSESDDGVIITGIQTA